MASLDTGAKDVTLAQILAGNIYNLSQTTGTITPTPALVALLASQPIVGVIRNIATCPDFALVYTPLALVVLITGNRDTAMGVLVASGYAVSPNARAPLGFNTFFLSAARQIRAAIASAGIAVPARIFIAGHSIGGSIGAALAALFRDNTPNQSISVVTFGSPKPGDNRCQDSLNGIDVGRWMNQEDPVPFIPPLPNQAIPFYFVTPPPFNSWFVQYQQVGPGQVMDINGGLVDGMYPMGNPGFTGLSIANFLVTYDGTSQGGTVYHTMLQYLNRLSFLVDQLPRAEKARNNEIIYPVGDHTTLNPVPMPSKSVPPSDLVPPVPPVIPPGFTNPYYSARENGQHVVQSLGITLAVCKGGKSARNLARSLNTAWRRWLNTRSVDAPSLSSSVDFFFTQ